MNGYITYLAYDAVVARNEDLRRNADDYRREHLASGAHRDRRHGARFLPHALARRPRAA
jgi:hypothetical protein